MNSGDDFPTDVSVDRARAAAALRQIREGGLVLLQSQDRASLVMAASAATTSQMAFLVRHSSGFVTVALPERVCDRIGISPMWSSSVSHRSSFGVSIDLATGAGTGISAADRAATARACANPSVTADHFTRPGHLVTARVAKASDQQPDIATAAVMLAYEATGVAAGLFADLPSDVYLDAMATGQELTRLTASYSIPMLNMADAITSPSTTVGPHRLRTHRLTRSEARSPHI